MFGIFKEKDKTKDKIKVTTYSVENWCEQDLLKQIHDFNTNHRPLGYGFSAEVQKKQMDSAEYLRGVADCIHDSERMYKIAQFLDELYYFFNTRANIEVTVKYIDPEEGDCEV